MKNWLLAWLIVLSGRLVPRLRERIVPQRPPNARAERAAITLLLLGGACAAAFPVMYGLDVGNLTQVLGASLGLALVLTGAALIVVGRGVVVTEENEEEYPPHDHPEEQRKLEQLVVESGDSISRKRLLTIAGGAAGGALAIAFLTPAVSLGPLFRIAPFFASPWRRGRRLVDENGRPYKAADLHEGTFYTAFPDGVADKEQLGAPLVLIRLPETSLRLPAGRSNWAPGGILAYSKICTHAGCAISLYRAPLFRPNDPGPALVCPCHYSTFDPAKGGTVEFGPAGRPLPQLPLMIDGSGVLRAAGNFSGAVGPSWWGVRNRKPGP